MFYGNIETKLKYKKRAEYWSNSTGSCEVHGKDKKTIEARSYRHWLFVKNINGLVVFNDYSYSNSTSGHQCAVRDLLKQLKIKVDVFVYQRESLDRGVVLEHLYEELILAEVRLARKGLTKKTRQRLERQRNEAGTSLFKLLNKKVAKPFTKKRQAEMKLEIEKNEAERLEKSRQEARELRAKRKLLEPELSDFEPIGLEQAEARMNDTQSIEIK